MAGTGGRFGYQLSTQHCQGPAIAHALATQRASSLFAGWRELWQAKLHLPFFHTFQFEGSCMQQRLLERQGPASARTLASLRACRRFPGKRECWQRLLERQERGLVRLDLILGIDRP